MNKPESRNLDIEGQKTLEIISQANRFNQWMFNTIRPFCTGKILEIGSGIGNISEYFINDGYDISLSDLRQNYTGRLKEKFSSFQNLRDILLMDLTDPAFEDKFSNYREHFDTIFALNVVEHIEDDILAVHNCRYLLKAGGRLIILVPAYAFLYNRFDELLGHFRRYTKKSLKQIIIENGFEIIRSKYFNLAGIPGWFVSGKLQNNDTIPGGQMKLYNSLVPVFKLMDKLILHSAGLSIIVVGEK